jgi:hypothetical protein
VSFILGSSILHFNMAVKTISVATMLSLRPLIESTIDTCRPSRAREWRLRLGSCRWAAARLIGWFGATTEVRHEATSVIWRVLRSVRRSQSSSTSSTHKRDSSQRGMDCGTFAPSTASACLLHCG